MTAGGETGARRTSHQHTIYCSAADRVLIGKRAQEAGMNFSRFMIACALHGGDEDDGEEGPRLVLSEDEQRSLYVRMALLFLLFQLPLFLLLLTAINLGLVPFEVGLDLRRQAFHLVHRAGAAVEMPPEVAGSSRILRQSASARWAPSRHSA